MSSDLSEGEKESTPGDSMPRVESSLTLSSSNLGEVTAPDREKPAKRLYIVLIRCVSMRSFPKASQLASYIACRDFSLYQEIEALNLFSAESWMKFVDAKCEAVNFVSIILWIGAVCTVLCVGRIWSLVGIRIPGDRFVFHLTRLSL